MRHFVSIVALLLLIGSIPAVSVTAQQSSLLDLLPTAADLGPAFVVVDNRTRTLAEQATGFANADEAARLLAGWEWQENVFRVFQTAESTPTGAPLATLDISLTRFANAEGAALALPYFLSDRAAVLAQDEVKSQNLISRPIGDETRVLSGPVEGGDDTTLYVRTGALLLRLSLTSTSGAPAMSPERDRARDRRPGHGPIASRHHHRHATCCRSLSSKPCRWITRRASASRMRVRWTSRRSSSAWPRTLTPQPPCRPSAGRVGSTASSPASRPRAGSVGSISACIASPMPNRLPRPSPISRHRGRRAWICNPSRRPRSATAAPRWPVPRSMARNTPST